MTAEVLATPRDCLTQLASLGSCDMGRVLSELSSDDLHTLHEAIGKQVTAKQAVSTASNCSSVGPASTAPSAAKRRSGGAAADADAATAAALTPKPPAAPKGEGEGRPRAAQAPPRMGSAKSVSTTTTSAAGRVQQTPEERARDAAAARRECVAVQSSFEPAAKYSPGILEMERRYVRLREVFRRWDSSDSGNDSTISVTEFKVVLAYYYSTTPDRLTPIPDPVTSTLDWKTFQNVIHSLSYTSSPRDFDLLVEFLLQCIGDVSKVQEKMRRTQLLEALFVDLANSRKALIPLAGVDALLARFAGSLKESEGSADLLVSRIPPPGEGDKQQLDRKDFTALLLHVLYPTNSPQFDDAYYRLKRCAEYVMNSDAHNAFCRRFERYLEDTLLPELDQRCPLIMHGMHHDPSTVIERAALERNAVLTPFILSHKLAEDDALSRLVKYGFQRGEWLCIITDPQYCPDRFLRQLGVILSTNASKGPGMVHKRQRIFVYSRERSISHWPNILTMMSTQVNLDNV